MKTNGCKTQWIEKPKWTDLMCIFVWGNWGIIYFGLFRSHHMLSVFLLTVSWGVHKVKNLFLVQTENWKMSRTERDALCSHVVHSCTLHIVSLYRICVSKQAFTKCSSLPLLKCIKYLNISQTWEGDYRKKKRRRVKKEKRRKNQHNKYVLHKQIPFIFHTHTSKICLKCHTQKKTATKKKKLALIGPKIGFIFYIDFVKYDSNMFL